MAEFKENTGKDNRKSCPICGEYIKSEAQKCIHCGEYFSKRFWTLDDKTIWDFVSLIIVPITLILVAGFFTSIQEQRQDEREATRTAAEAESQRTLEVNRANAVMLQSYFDDISVLLLEEDLTDERVQNVVRARTLAVMGELDGPRNKTITRFLRDSGMNGWVFAQADMRNFDLREAYLTNADLSGVDLRGADLRDADMNGAVLHSTVLSTTLIEGASLIDADLNRIDFSGSNLSNVNLYAASIINVDFSHANLENIQIGDGWVENVDFTNANLRNAGLGSERSVWVNVDMSGANLRNAILNGLGGVSFSGADLTEAIMSDYTWHVDTNLSNADLINADLSWSTWGVVDFSNADLSGANLNNAGLSEAILNNTNLTGATYTAETIWPNGFDPPTAGAILVQSITR